MPYKIKEKGTKYQVMNIESGKVHSKGTTKGKAEKQVRLLRAIEHGFKPRRK